MERTEITTKLKELIETETKTTIASDDQELDIDSFMMMMVITFIDEQFKIALDMEELDFDAFTSLDTLADLVINKSGDSA